MYQEVLHKTLQQRYSILPRVSPWRFHQTSTWRQTILFLNAQGVSLVCYPTWAEQLLYVGGSLLHVSVSCVCKMCRSSGSSTYEIQHYDGVSFCNMAHWVFFPCGRYLNLRWSVCGSLRRTISLTGLFTDAQYNTFMRLCAWLMTSFESLYGSATTWGKGRCEIW